MKKLMILVSCFALILILSKMSFAQDVDVVVEPVPPCSCSHCAATPPVLPFAAPYPIPYPYPYKPYPHRIGGLPYPPAVGPAVAPYPYEVASLKTRIAARRAARLAAKSLLAPAPVAVAPPAPVAVAPPDLPAPDAAAIPGNGQVVQTGKWNSLRQRTGDAPVINFMSIVRAPREPYAGYYPYPMPAPYPPMPHHPPMMPVPPL